MQKIKNILMVVPLLFLACTCKGREEKSQYQDTICSEAEEGNGEKCCTTT